MNSKIKEVLQCYIQQDNRIAVKLQLCIALLRMEKSAVEIIRSRAKKNTQPLKLFRILILIHTCYMQKMLPAEQAIQLLSLVRKQSKPRPKIRLDQLVNECVISKYVLYLQKCYQSLTSADYEKYMDASQKLYCHLNLLKTGLSFVDILYTFGRYFKKDYMFIVDFNIVVAVDFAQLYENKIKTILKTNRPLWDDEMRLEIEKVHQKMYIVYYNCYFYKEIKSFTPRFIETESAEEKNRPFKSSNKQNRSKINNKSRTKCSSSNMSLSSVLSNNKSKSILEGSITNMMNSTVISKPNYYKYNKCDPNMSMGANMSESYVSEFTCDVSDKKDEYVLDEVAEIEEDNPYKLILSFERVINAIEENSQKVANSKDKNVAQTA